MKIDKKIIEAAIDREIKKEGLGELGFGAASAAKGIVGGAANMFSGMRGNYHLGKVTAQVNKFADKTARLWDVTRDKVDSSVKTMTKARHPGVQQAAQQINQHMQAADMELEKFFSGLHQGLPTGLGQSQPNQGQPQLPQQPNQNSQQKKNYAQWLAAKGIDKNDLSAKAKHEMLQKYMAEQEQEGSPAISTPNASPEVKDAVDDKWAALKKKFGETDEDPFAAVKLNKREEVPIIPKPPQMGGAAAIPNSKVTDTGTFKPEMPQGLDQEVNKAASEIVPKIQAPVPPPAEKPAVTAVKSAPPMEKPPVKQPEEENLPIDLPRANMKGIQKGGLKFGPSQGKIEMPKPQAPKGELGPPPGVKHVSPAQEKQKAAKVDQFLSMKPKGNVRPQEKEIPKGPMQTENPPLDRKDMLKKAIKGDVPPEWDVHGAQGPKGGLSKEIVPPGIEKPIELSKVKPAKSADRKAILAKSPKQQKMNQFASLLTPEEKAKIRSMPAIKDVVEHMAGMNLSPEQLVEKIRTLSLMSNKQPEPKMPDFAQPKAEPAQLEEPKPSLDAISPPGVEKPARVSARKSKKDLQK